MGQLFLASNETYVDMTSRHVHGMWFLFETSSRGADIEKSYSLFCMEKLVIAKNLWCSKTSWQAWWRLRFSKHGGGWVRYFDPTAFPPRNMALMDSPEKAMLCWITIILTDLGATPSLGGNPKGYLGLKIRLMFYLCVCHSKGQRAGEVRETSAEQFYLCSSKSWSNLEWPRQWV